MGLRWQGNRVRVRERARSTTYCLHPSLGSQRQLSCQCLRRRNPRHGAEGPIAPARYATTRLHISHPLKPIVIPSAHPRALSWNRSRHRRRTVEMMIRGAASGFFASCLYWTRVIRGRDHTKTNYCRCRRSVSLQPTFLLMPPAVDEDGYLDAQWAG